MVPPTSLGVGVAAANLGSAGGEITGPWNNLVITKPLSAAALPAPTLIGLGGVYRSLVVANEFLTNIDATGRPQHAQPLFSNLGGTVLNSQLAVMANGTVKCRTTAGTGSPEDCSTLPTAATAALTGDVTKSAGSNATTIATNAVTNAKAAQMANGTVKCRTTAGTGNPEDCTTLPTAATAALTGDVTKSAGSNTTTLAAGSASNLTSGTLAAARLPALTGDATSSAGSAVTTVSKFNGNSQVAKPDGGTGATTGRGAATNLSLDYILCQSAATGMSVTGTTSETALANCQVPAGAIGIDGALRVTSLWTITASTNAKTTRVKFSTATGTGGTLYFQVANSGGTITSVRCTTLIYNRHNASSQVGTGNTACTDTSGGAASNTTSAIDTTAISWVNLTGELANSGETITLEAYRVEIFPAGGN